VWANSEGIAIFPGNGDGTFGEPVGGSGPNDSIAAVAVPDVNGDGIPDLLITGSKAVYVQLGKGDGTFSAPVFTLNAGSRGVAFGDFNGDGRLDLAVVGTGSTMVSVLLGKGDGTFSNAVPIPLPAPAVGNPGQIAVADFNGDGHPDLVVLLATTGNVPQHIATLLGKGDGTFPILRLSPGSLVGFVAADFNADKIPDLIGSVGGSTGVSVGNGDGTFQPAELIMAGTEGVLVTDINGDGSPDILALLEAGGFASLLNLSKAPPPLKVVSAATLAPGPLAPNTIAAAFGTGILTAGKTVSGSQPLPNSLYGVTVMVQDSTGVSRQAPLCFASYNQVNFVVPPATVPGPATVAIKGTSSGKSLTTQIEVDPVAPALFTVGAGVAAAYAIQVAPSGAQAITPSPIDVSQPGQVFLVLFGTGFDSGSSMAATVQGVTVPVTYAGPQASFAGLDQANLGMPPSLAGTGVASVTLSIGGVASNTIFITIR
jgi:uncharacterized protein (TIGR03437 family)